MVLFAPVFNRKNRKNQDGKALVQIRAYQNGRCRYFSTGVYVEPRFWSARLNRVVDHPNQLELNAIVRRQLQDWEDYALRMTQKHGFVSLEALDGFFREESHETLLFFQDKAAAEQQPGRAHFKGSGAHRSPRI